jgi:hypothetical protein
MYVHRHCEERRDEAIHSFFACPDGLLRFARNDGLKHRASQTGEGEARRHSRDNTAHPDVGCDNPAFIALSSLGMVSIIL